MFLILASKEVIRSIIEATEPQLPKQVSYDTAVECLKSNLVGLKFKKIIFTQFIGKSSHTS